VETFLYFIAEVFAEFVLQLLFEMPLVSVDGVFKLASRVGRTVFKVVLYAELGLLLGAASLWVCPNPVVAVTPNPWSSLLCVPVCVALFTVKASKWLQSKRGWDGALSRFWYSLILAIVFAVVRYFYIIKSV
jgi:hypothetical protein